jgi:hypothetical protein
MSYSKLQCRFPRRLADYLFNWRVNRSRRRSVLRSQNSFTERITLSSDRKPNGETARRRDGERLTNSGRGHAGHPGAGCLATCQKWPIFYRLSIRMPGLDCLAIEDAGAFFEKLDVNHLWLMVRTLEQVRAFGSLCPWVLLCCARSSSALLESATNSELRVRVLRLPPDVYGGNASARVLRALVRSARERLRTVRRHE